jgi:all-trans-8'-apo-beta-carotenal 15,15'-oxygenase
MTEAMALPAGAEHAEIALADGEVPWSRCLEEPPREHGFEPLRVQGSLPRELAGRAYFHGPGMVSAFGDRGAHWLDGDGVVGAFWFQNGKAAGAARVIETEGLRAERAAGRRLFGGFARGPSSLRARLGKRKARAGHGLLPWDGRLLALGDGAPVELDLADLACRGEVDPVHLGLGRAAPHLRRAPGRRGVFGLAAAPLASHVDVVRLGDEGPAERVGTLDAGRPTLLHDFALTARHLVMAAPPIRARGWGGWPGAAPLADRLRWDASAGTEIIVASLDEPERARRFTVSALYATHFCNAFERGGELVVDLVAAEDFDGVDGWQRALAGGLGGAPLRTRLWRIVLDLATGAARGEPILEQSCEAPVIAPSLSGEPYRLAWLVGHSSPRAAEGLPNRLLEVDVESGRVRELGFGEGCYPSQPVFVPRGGGESGWLVTQVYDALRHRTFAAVVDSCAFEAPIARAYFDHALPYAMHGSWMETARGS